MDWTQQPLDSSGNPMRVVELPERFREASPAWLPMPMREIVKRYLQDFHTYRKAGVAPSFFGRAETYKTCTAAVIARWVAGAALLNVEFVDAGVEFGRLELQRFSDDTRARVEHLATVDFLVLDDITNIRPRTQAEAFLMQVVNPRFDNQLPTIYTGNWAIERDRLGFIDRYSPALDRRIRRGADADHSVSGGFLIVTG